MEKLATTGRLVTRDNAEQEASSVWLLERSGASSGRALLAVPIGQIAGSAAQIEEVAAREHPAATRVENDSSTRRIAEDRRRIAPVGIRGTRSRKSVEDQESPGYSVETEVGNVCGYGRGGSDGDAVVRLAGSSCPVDRHRCFDGIAENEADRKWCRSKSGWRRRSRTGSVERRRYRRHLPTGSGELSLLFGIATIVAAVVCVPAAAAVPMLSRENPPLSPTGPRHDLDRSTGLEDVYEDAFEDAFREEDRATARTVLDETELDTIRRSIVRGLGLKRIPDPTKANISQAEYERAHREYLMKTQQSFDEHTSGSKKKLHVFPATAYPGNESSRLAQTSERERHYRHRLFFPVEIPEEDDNALIDHATLRLLLHSPTTNYTESSELDVLLYLRMFHTSRKLISRTRLELQDSRNSRWLEFDATLVASSWLETALENVGLELEFLVDGKPVHRTFSSPVLNVFTISSPAVKAGRMKRSSPEELMSLHKGRRTKCKGESKKCCRHELTVMFKDLKGFEFIVYPKTFDAGYCKGRCPPRYNPAHHHALLQSLLWKEDRKKVPKPCCAPSKLDQLMIVYFDENDSTQLKVSYWKNIQVLECACS